MRADPRAARGILDAAGVECPELDAFLAEPDEVVDVRTADGAMVTMDVWSHKIDSAAAIIALARLVVKYKSDES